MLGFLLPAIRLGFYSEVYIIKGSDTCALMLGENISTHDKSRQRPDQKRLVVFLIGEEKDANDIIRKTAHFGGIVQVIDGNYDLRYYLEKIIDSGNLRPQATKFHIVFTQEEGSVQDDVQRTAAFLKEKDVNTNNVDIYALTTSAWDRDAVEAITQAKEGGQRKYPFTIHIIDEVDLLVRGAHLDYCRRDSKARLHSCLVTWDELDEVSTVYQELARKAGNEKEQTSDFKQNDRENVVNIPEFLRKGREHK